MLHSVGNCTGRIFGNTPAERLSRQVGSRSDGVLVADAGTVLSDNAVDWLYQNPAHMLLSASGRPLAIVVDAPDRDAATAAIKGQSGDFPMLRVDELGSFFNRKLRRREPLLAISLAEHSHGAIERMLFDSVYKGVTDLVTKWVWPLPAFFISKVCARIGVIPNQVTSIGLILAILAGWFFYEHALVNGLIAAWAMTFLDTVDGKLARVTVTSSRFGDRLDHGLDYIHPPIWWLCLAHGLASLFPGNAGQIWQSVWTILACYVLGRIVEELFKKRIGYNQYMWKPFDSAFRLVVARRNILLLIMTISMILRDPVLGFEICAFWSVISALIQIVRYLQAEACRQTDARTSWLM